MVISCGDTMKSGSDQDRQAALADLKRLARESDVIGGLFGRGAAHFAAADAPADDPIERWGRRIGRVLGAVAFVALCAYLYLNYVH